MSEHEKKTDAMETDEGTATTAAAAGSAEPQAASPAPTPAPVDPAVLARRQVLADYRRKLLEHRELEAKVRTCTCVREILIAMLFVYSFFGASSLP